MLLAELDANERRNLLYGKNSRGFTALMRAAECGKCELAAALLNSLGNESERENLIKLQNEDGKNAISLAQENQKDDMSALLRDMALLSLDTHP